jgi:hypothetical protein
MASLLVDLHRAGVYWGDCSLANTLFRRDGDKIQAYLVDAETSEIHPGLSDGQRAYDLEILVENVAFGLADLGAMQGRDDAFDDAVAAAETVQARYSAVWDELHLVPEVAPGDRHAIRSRIRRLNDLGFAIDEVALEPTSPTADVVRLRIVVANRRFHAHLLQKLTGLVALEGQARLLNRRQLDRARHRYVERLRPGRRRLAHRRATTRPCRGRHGHQRGVRRNRARICDMGSGGRRAQTRGARKGDLGKGAQAATALLRGGEPRFRVRNPLGGCRRGDLRGRLGVQRTAARAGEHSGDGPPVDRVLVQP